MRKLITMYLLLCISLALYGCSNINSNIENRKKVVSFNEYAKDDNLTEIFVQAEGKSFRFLVSRIVNYERERKEFIFNKDEARYVILNSLGYFSKYVVNMDKECEEKLGIKLKYVEPDKYKHVIYEMHDSFFDRNFVFYEYGGLVDRNVTTKVYINDYIYLGQIVRGDGTIHDDSNMLKGIDRMSRQNKSDLESLFTLRREKWMSEINYETKEGYIYCGSKPNFHFSVNGHATVEFYHATFCFKDGVIDYDSIINYNKYNSAFGLSRYRVYGTRGNYYDEYIDEYGNEHVDKRDLYKGFDENTTFEEFKTVLREGSLFTRWFIYVDCKE